MKSRTDSITSSVIRISVAPSGQFSYNMFLILSERPALIHTGRLQWFDETLARVSEIIDPSTLEIIVFSHFEADECGALNSWLKLAPKANVYVGRIGQANLEDFSIRPPTIIKDSGLIDLGNKHLTLLETPHFPHNWDACLFYDAQDKILFSSDVGAHVNFGDLFIGEDQLPSLINFQNKTRFMSGGKFLQLALQKLRKLDIEYLAIHHGATLRGQMAIFKFFDLLEWELHGSTYHS